jgi:hypothetical protein
VRRQSRRFASIAVASITVVAITATTASAGGRAGSLHKAPLSPKAIYSAGVPNVAEPSGMSPPTASALPGYQLTYVNDFLGTSLPKGWGPFNGIPQGDNQSEWSPSHVVVGGGVMRLITSQDSTGKWVTGGVSQFGVGHTYGAYFVRSRVTGPGPDQNEMLWPDANVWPPEVDFNEMGYPTTSTSWTVHFGHGSSFVQETGAFDMEKWHTFGVIWTPTSMTFTMDGHTWGSITNVHVIPHIKMSLDIQQQVWCQPDYACPTRASALEVDWVAEYQRG